MSVEKLYEAVKSGQVDPSKLNDAGKQALKSYIETKGSSTPSRPSTINAPSINVGGLPQPKAFQPSKVSIPISSPSAANKTNTRVSASQGLVSLHQDPIVSPHLPKRAAPGKVGSFIGGAVSGSMFDLGFDDVKRQVPEEHQGALEAGRMAGMMLPIGAAYKLALTGTRPILSAMSRMLPKGAVSTGMVAPSAPATMAQQAATGLAIGPAYEGTRSLVSGERDIGEIAKGQAKAAIEWAVLDVIGIKVLSKAMGTTAPEVIRRELADATRNAISTIKTSKPTIDAKDLLEEASKKTAKDIGVDFDNLNTKQKDAIYRLVNENLTQTPQTEIRQLNTGQNFDMPLQFKTTKAAAAIDKPGAVTNIPPSDPVPLQFKTTKAKTDFEVNPIHARNVKPSEKVSLTGEEKNVIDFLDAQGRSIDDAISELETLQKTKIDDMIDYLKRTGNQGVKQGELYIDGETGLVLGRQGRGPRSEKEYRELAVKLLREGEPMHKGLEEPFPADAQFVSSETLLPYFKELGDKTKLITKQGGEEIAASLRSDRLLPPGQNFTMNELPVAPKPPDPLLLPPGQNFSVTHQHRRGVPITEVNQNLIPVGEQGFVPGQAQPSMASMVDDVVPPADVAGQAVQTPTPLRPIQEPTSSAIPEQAAIQPGINENGDFIRVKIGKDEIPLMGIYGELKNGHVSEITIKYMKKLKSENYYGTDSKLISKAESIMQKEVKSPEDIQTLKEIGNFLETTEVKHREMQRVADITVNDIQVNSKNTTNEENLFDKVIRRYIQTDAFDPETNARRAVGYDESKPFYQVMYKQMSDGQRNMLGWMQKASTQIDGLLQGINRVKFIKTNSPLKLADGRTVNMTSADKVSLYLHSLNADNRRHIIQGGFRLRKTKEYVKMTEAELDNIALTPMEKRVADAMHKFFNSLSKDAINETSLKIKGYRIAEINEYFPIVVDRSSKDKLIINPLFNNKSIEGDGVLKSRSEGAYGPIMLESVFQAYNRHLEFTSRYFGLAEPLRDAKAIIGNSRVSNKLNDRFKSSYTEYWKELFQHLEGQRGNTDTFNEFLAYGISNLSRAILGVNPWIALKQVASTVLATSEIKGRYMLRNFLVPTNKKIMEKYSPLIWYRNQGFITRETGEASLNALGIRQDWATGMIRFFDSKAINRIWMAAETETAALQPQLKKGSDAFYEVVARRAEEVIYRTQPNYTAMQRSSVGRTRNAAEKGFTLFATQTNKNYNILYNAVRTFTKTPAKSVYQVSTIAASGLVVAGVNALRNEYRGKETEWGKEIANTVSGQFYMVREIVNMTTTGFEPDHVALQAYKDVFASLAETGIAMYSLGENAFSGDQGNDVKFVKAIYSLAESTAQVRGMPAANIRREIETIMERYNPALYYEYQKVISTQSRSGQYSQLWDNLDKPISSKIMADMKEDGVTVSGLKSSANSREVSREDLKKAIDLYNRTR